MMKIEFFATGAGNFPVQRYLDKIDKAALAAIVVALKNLQSQGLSGENVRKLRERLWELKVGPQRVLFTLRDPEVLVLLHAFKKQSQRTRSVEIATALIRLTRLSRIASHPVPRKRHSRRPKRPV